MNKIQPEVTTLSNLLRQEFDSSRIKQRTGAGGKQFDYVPGGDVVERLIECNPTWDFEIQMVTFVEPPSIERKTREGKVYTKTFDPFWRVSARVTIPGLGYREGIGTQIHENEDSVKGAVTDAFKLCMKMFGVALQLYRDEGSTLKEEEVPERLGAIEKDKIIALAEKLGCDPPKDLDEMSKVDGIAWFQEHKPKKGVTSPSVVALEA